MGAAASAVPIPAGAVVFRIAPEPSTATFRVRERLAGRDLPGDATGTAGPVTGQLVLGPSGAVLAEASQITVDLTGLTTDVPLRDAFVKQTTLQTQQFPTAEFVPTRADGLPSPLPVAGQHTFTLTGLMTIHGRQKELTWNVTATRDGGSLTGTATTAFAFGAFGMTPPAAPAVLSVADEIRLEVRLVATQDP